MGRTGNMITGIKDFLRQMCVNLEKSAYFGDGDGFNSNPEFVPKDPFDTLVITIQQWLCAIRQQAIT